ncbi:hypothetical protein N7504_004201 [Penicillium tannophilum]|nr:hypothetical protein N7504_004201 [Penicillium tannophilum]
MSFFAVTVGVGQTVWTGSAMFIKEDSLGQSNMLWFTNKKIELTMNILKIDYCKPSGDCTALSVSRALRRRVADSRS